MSTTLSIAPETQELIDAVKQWSIDVVRPKARESDRNGGYPMSRKDLLADCPIDISPIAFGSLDLDDEALIAKRPWLKALAVDGKSHVAARLVEAITYGDGWAYPLMPDGGIAEILIAKLGTPEQKERYIEGGRRGDFSLSGWAMTEETGGNDVASIKTTIVKDGDEYVINGAKRFLSNGADVDWTVVFGTIDPALGMAGIRAVIVEMGTPGFTVTREAENKIGMRFNRQGAYKFDNVRVPKENFLAGERDGADTMAAMATFNRTRPYCGSSSVAGAQAALDYTLELLVPQREAMSARRWQRIEDEFAHMNQLLDEQRQLVYRSAWLNDHGQPDIKESAAAKVHAPRLAERIILRCMQLIGPDALGEDHLLEKWYRDTRLLDIVEGTAHIQKMVISRQLLGPGAARA